jgi:ubiquinol-cytochrome c reductase cytochrome b/c1 subunit
VKRKMTVNLGRYIFKEFYGTKEVYEGGLLYATPVGLNYFWNFGSLALVLLLTQIVTGFMLALWYIPSIDLAFDSVEFIMREVRFGWLLRYLHANGASFFFIVVYIHVLRGLFFSSYTWPRQWVWYSGVIILLLLIATAFFGYVLPWGQMSYWAATVITSLTSIVPILGQNLLVFIWGGITIEQATLTRIYGLHFLLPFVILGLSGYHILVLHQFGSTNVLGIKTKDSLMFHPYFSVKDVFGILYLFLFYIMITFFYPNLLGHPDNYIPANPDVTPLHIVPEWYFLLFYGILRSVPSKIGGVFLLVSAILVILLLPIFSQPLIRSGYFRYGFIYLYIFFIGICVILSWSGGNPIAMPYYEICQLGTFCYFGFFGLLILYNSFEQLLWLKMYSNEDD